MRRAFYAAPVAGVIVIGEGERDRAPMTRTARREVGIDRTGPRLGARSLANSNCTTGAG
jgi:fructose-1,6-bisphosphatase/sedoheptulose 1,7-bisphosphatase-like protein